jgi:choice-of-anchor B domain-containing protein
MKKILFLLLVFSSSLVMGQKNIQYRSSLHYPRILSNLWGYYDSLTHKEYALVGEETGLSIVDVTDPDNISELFFVPTDTSAWKEPKTWSHYAYCVNEHGGGLLIVDLGDLPNTVSYSFWDDIPDYNFRTAHTCFVDNNGFLYLNGSNLFNRGSIICDLKPDPMHPQYIGLYDERYVHDCFARNDTLFTSEIYDGQFSIIDVHDKANPIVLARQTTPFAFSHNIWPSDDNKYLFNTDERKFAPITAYDISDLNNITEIDKYRTSDVDSSIPHNVYFKGNYLYSSYYHNGVVIVDATKPDNLVEVGNYDTSPIPPAGGFAGCWGVYCFLPSGNILCSDRQEGLFVLTPTLTRACYLEGAVTNINNGQPVSNLRVDIIGNNNRYKRTNFVGQYKTGVADSGTYDVRFYDEAFKCATKIVSGISLTPGNVTTLNVSINCQLPSGIEESLNNNNGFIVTNTLFTNNTTIYLRNDNSAQSVVSIYSYSGQLVKQYEIETPQAEITVGDDLAAGAYLINWYNGNTTQTLKVIKVN